MKVGAEDRKKLTFAIALMLLAVLSLVYVLSRPSGTAAVATSTATAKRPSAKKKGEPQAAENLDPTLRLGLLRASEGVKYAGTGRNIFRAQADEPIPKVVKNPLTDKAAKNQPPPPPPGPPPPPPINLKFYGFANRPGEPIKKVFLSEGDTIFIAGEGDVVDRRYRIVKIGQASVEVEDLLNNHKQTIPLSSQS